MSTIDDVVKALESSIDAKVANAPSDAPYPVTGTVASVSKDGTVWVMLDGSDHPTPAERTTVAVSKDDRVKGEIHDKMLWVTGNMSDIFIQVGSDGEARAASAAVEESVVKNLGKFTADWAYIKEFVSESITAQEAQIQYIIAHSVTTEYLEANYATITSLTAVDAKIDNVESQMVKTEQLEAVDGRIDTLFSGFIKASELETDAAKAEWLSANYATVNDLDARYTQTNVLDARYATVDFANIVGADITDAKMKELVARSGWFEDITSEGGTFTGKLKTVILDGDTALFQNIYANALKLLGEDGLYHALNFLPYDESATYTAIQSPTGNPAQQGWYVLDKNGNYIRTTDTTVVSGTSYFSKSYDNATTAAYWSQYGEQLENGLHGSNIIAETITATQIDVSTLVAAMMLTQYIQIGASGAVHIESNGERFSFFNGGYGWDRIAEKWSSYFRQVPTPVLNPKANLYYELDADQNYVRTQDETAVSGKAYYFQYEAVSSPSGDPSAHHWYEMDSTGHMDLTQDHSVLSGKTYYKGLITATDKLDGEVAYIAVDPDTNQSWFYINNEVVVNELRFGKWQWKTTQGNNLVLKWMG